MHKKLEAELVSIAHSILQMKNREDAIALREKAQQLYEKLSVLTFIDTYLDTTPTATETKEELVTQFEEKVEQVDLIVENTPEVQAVEKVIDTPEVVEKTEEIQEEIEEDEPTIQLNIIDEIEEIQKEEIEEELSLELDITEEIIEEPKKQLTIEEEFKDAVSVDVTADLFQKLEVVETETTATLNDTLSQDNLQVGLNDRIAFVKHLFDGSQEDFNRVLSQLNSFKTEKEATSFVKKMVKPDYDWSGKEEYEDRLLALIERKFA